ncbi:hypothetical protein SZN_38158, partial [Streptomyces zinciresistens K42]
DPAQMAEPLTGGRGHLYWRRADAGLPYVSSVGHGVLALDGERYVAGWLATAEESVELPATSPVPPDGDIPAVG